jgi:ketosteroid isomerase-like protein
MDANASKQTVRAWFEAVNRGDETAILDLLTEDFTFEAMLRQPQWMKYTWNRQQFAATPAAMSRLMTAPITMQIVDMIAEGNKVSVQATTHSTMLNGKLYDNAYHFAFLVRDGRIAEAKEYSCSHLAQDCFSDLNPWKSPAFEHGAAGSSPEQAA